MKKEYNYHYVYRITNVVTGYHYYGSKSCNEEPKENIGKKYFSNSTNKLFIQDQKNNPQDYKYKVIKIFESCREDATNLEVILHKKFDVKNHPKFINKSNQSSKHFNYSKSGVENHFYGKKHTIETRELLSKQRLGKNTGFDNNFYGKKHTEEVKKKLSKQQKGCVIVQDKDGNRFTIKNTDEKYLSGDYVSVNKINSKEDWYRKKLSENHANVSGSKNPMAKVIEIYNASDELMFVANGNFKQVCEENNLPFSQLYTGKNKVKYAFDNMTKQTETKHRKKGIYPKFKGWYAKVVD